MTGKVANSPKPPIEEMKSEGDASRFNSAFIEEPIRQDHTEASHIA